MKEAILLRTDRGGKDPDRYWIGLSIELWETLPQEDPWKKLGDLVDEDNPGVLTDIHSTRPAAISELSRKKYRVKRTEYAQGY